MKKTLSVLLSVLMVFSLVSTGAYAVDPPESCESFVDMMELFTDDTPTEYHWDFSDEDARTWVTDNVGYELKYEDDMMKLDTDYEAYAGMPYISHHKTALDTSTYRYMVVRARNKSDATYLYMYYATTTHPAMSEDYVCTIRMIAQSDAFVDYVVDMSQFGGWTGDYTSCMLVCHMGGKGEIDFKDIYFTSDYYADDLYHYPLHSSAYKTAYPLAGVPDHSSYMAHGNVRRISASSSNGYVEFPAPTETVKCADYPYFVIKSLNTEDAYTGGIIDYFTTSEKPTRGPTAGSVFRRGDSGVFNYHIINLSAAETYVGELAGGMLQFAGAGTLDIVDMFMAKNTDFLHNETGVVPTTFSLLGGSGKIDTVDGTLTIRPELLYVNGETETDYSTLVWDTDSICAIPTVNDDHSLTLCGKNNGQLKVSATMTAGGVDYTAETVITVSGQPPRSLAETVKLMTYGNSIMNHGPNDALGWHGNWGMAASAAEKDYVHQLTALLKDRYGENNVTQVYGSGLGSFEGSINASCDENTDWAASLTGVTSAVQKEMPDIVTLQIGENCAADVSTAAYKHALASLVDAVKAGNPDAVIILTLPWWSYGGIGTYLGAKALAAELDLPLADLATLAFDRETNWADQTVFTQYAVYSHPGDKGMENIAKEFYGVMKPYLIRDFEGTLTFSAVPESVKIGTDVHTISAEGGSIDLEASVLPADAAQELVYASSDEKVVTVGDDGIISAVFNGSAVITVSSAYDASVTAAYSVTVTGQKGPFTVTYHKNTSDAVDNMPSDNEWAKGEYTEKTIPARSLYRFMGWALTADGEAKEEFDITSDTDLYAVWEKAYRWDFNREGDKEGFTVDHGFNQYVENGVFRAMATYTDEAAGNVLTVISPALSLESSVYNRLVITMQNSVYTTATKLRLTVNTDKGTYQYSKPVTSTDMHTYSFNLTDVQGTITGFSFIPVDVDCSVFLDEIRFESAYAPLLLHKAVFGAEDAAKMKINGVETAMTDGETYQVELTDGLGTVDFDGTAFYVSALASGGGYAFVSADKTVFEYVYNEPIGCAVAAAFDADGRLLATKLADLTQTGLLLMDVTKAATVKSFLFERADTLKVISDVRTDEIASIRAILPEDVNN